MRPLTVVIKIDNYIPSFCRLINGIIRNKKNIPCQVKYMKQLVESKMSEKHIWSEVCILEIKT